MTCLFGVPGVAFEGGGGGAFVLRPFLVDTSMLSVLEDDPTEDVEDVEPCKDKKRISLLFFTEVQIEEVQTAKVQSKENQII